VSWLTYADRLMEFPTALLGVALGVVLLPQLSAASARATPMPIPACSTGGCGWWCCWRCPCAVALLVFPQPLVAVLFHYGVQRHRCHEDGLGAAGYGVGLLGMVAVKMLAPGFYARQDIRTPVRIAVVVLCARRR
jgi:putative peptidoglycan lipid II flippase